MQIGTNIKGQGHKNSTILVIAFTLVYLGVVLRTAWLTDDAAITFRTVLNFIHGFGPNFNIDERVQAYTHPLWFWLLAALTILFKNVYYAAFGACIAISIVTVALLLFQALPNRRLIGILGFSVIFSKAFVDFSSSGLENPLSQLLLFVAVVLASSSNDVGRGHRTTLFLLVCAGIYLNRPDMLLMVLPLVLYVALPARSNPKRLVFSFCIAALPIVLWTAFSLFYYGFPFPNTAYAKLGSGIGFFDRTFQGIKYYVHTGYRDPLTIAAIAAGVFFGLRGSRLSKSLAFGVILYLLYILSIGGDFMEGRFFTAPFFMSLLIIAREAPPKLVRVPAFVVAGLLGAVTFYPNILAGNSYSANYLYLSGIADERGFYFQKFGLFNATKETYARPPWQVTGRAIDVTCGGLGFPSILQGPGTHIIDTCGLIDPLLARLPARHDPNWRIGHFYRQLPTMYVESIQEGANLLTDPKTRAYWDSIRLVTRGPLFDRKRLVEIAKLNLGFVEKPDWDFYRFQEVPR